MLGATSVTSGWVPASTVRHAWHSPHPPPRALQRGGEGTRRRRPARPGRPGEQPGVRHAGPPSQPPRTQDGDGVGCWPTTSSQTLTGSAHQRAAHGRSRRHPAVAGTRRRGPPSTPRCRRRRRADRRRWSGSSLASAGALRLLRRGGPPPRAPALRLLPRGRAAASAGAPLGSSRSAHRAARPPRAQHLPPSASARRRRSASSWASRSASRRRWRGRRAGARRAPGRRMTLLDCSRGSVPSSTQVARRRARGPARGTARAPARGSRPARTRAGRAGSLATAVSPSARGQVEHDGEVGHQPVGRPARQLGDLAAAQVAAGALVGDGGVDVAVGDHDRAPRERRHGRPSRRGRRGRRRTAAPRLRREVDPARLAVEQRRRAAARPTSVSPRARGSARRRDPGARSHSREQPRLGRLARAVAALEGDEAAG